jgi:proteasome lid subunit RPN8/RPN11
METSALELWRTPQSPFSIEYSRRVLEEIRLAVVDAFFSLPRGGVEIGGVLLGKFRDQRLEIASYSPLECEHAFGPSFTLSPRDQERLREILVRARAGGNDAVGWYHSHHRSEIFLSEADLEIHRTYFPEPWQVALVLRPSLSQPMRAGFFFREGDGSIHSASSYQEFPLEPLTRRLPPNGHGVLDKDAPAAPIPSGPLAERRQEPVAPVPPPASPLAVTTGIEPPLEPAPTPPPRFLLVEAPKSKRKLWLGGALAASTALGVFAFETRDVWWPPLQDVMPRIFVSRAAGPPLFGLAVALSAIDNQGQLQIRWDTTSRAAAEARDAVLSLTDGGPELRINLDGPHLRAGSFTYARHSERVDIRLTIQTPTGPLETATTFVGSSPATSEAEAAAANAEAAELARENDQLRQQITGLKSLLDAQTARAKTLEEQLNQLRKLPERKPPAPPTGTSAPLN